jgi:hypothetical protein
MAKKHSVLPLIILVIVVAILSFIGYVVFTIVQDISHKAKEKMEKKHVSLTRDGVKVSVKQINDEDYKDRSQRCVITGFLGIHLKNCQQSVFTGHTAHICWTLIKDLIYDYSVLVKVWNHASFPGYKSRLWNANAAPELCAEENIEKRRPYVLSALSIQSGLVVNTA